MELRRYRYFLFCLIVVLGTVQLWADVTGSIVGYVRDKSGAVLPSATVTAVQTATGYSRTVATDTSGQYSILALPPGRYRLTASVQSFQQGVVDNVDLNVNDALHFDFDLQVGSVSESVSVDANALQVQTSTSTGTTVRSLHRFSPCRSMAVRISICFLFRPVFLPRIRTAGTPIRARFRFVFFVGRTFPPMASRSMPMPFW